jgi:acyl-lipid (8-3)-desaturase
LIGISFDIDKKKKKEKESVMASKKYSWQDVAKHNSDNDCWLSIRGKVYDVTAWVDDHPGGRDMLVLNGGKDATQLFEAYHGEHVAPKYLDRYEVGTLTSSEYPSFPPVSGFYRTLKRRVASHFAKSNVRKTSANWMLARAALFVVLSFALWHCAVEAVRVYDSLLVGATWALLAGVVSAWISLMPVHEASHGASTSSPWAWRVMGAMHDWLNGASYYNWLHQHLLGHHPFTSIEELDPDIVTADPDARRIKPSQRWLPLYKWQHIYMPLLYGLLAPKFRVNDVTIVMSSRANGAIRMNAPDAWHWFNFVAGKLFFFVWRFALPAASIGVFNAWLLCFVADLAISYYLALVFQPNHVVNEAMMLSVDKATNTIDMDWAEMQVRTTIDYGLDSRLTHFLTGGLNFQVVHHLFPGVCQLHYADIYPIVMDTCQEYNIPYASVPTYWDALKCHFRYLYDMGQIGVTVHAP